MAPRSERRSLMGRVILAGGLLALSASFLPASAVEPAPTVKGTSVDSGWSGSDRIITARFSENLDPGSTASPKTTATLTSAVKGAMPVGSINVSNDTVSVLVGSQAHPDIAGRTVYMHQPWGPYTVNFTVVSKSADTATGTYSFTFNVDGAPAAIRLESPSDTLPNFGGVRDNPLVVPGPGGDNTIYTDSGAAVFAPGDPIRLEAYISDRTDANGRSTYTSGVRSLKVRLTDMATDEVTTIYSRVNSNCSATLCTGAFDLLDHSGDDTPGPDNSVDLSDEIAPGMYSMQVVATDLSGLNAYTKPIAIIRLA